MSEVLVMSHDWTHVFWLAGTILRLGGFDCCFGDAGFCLFVRPRSLQNLDVFRFSHFVSAGELETIWILETYRLFALCGLGLVYLEFEFRSMTVLRDSTSGSKRFFLFKEGSCVRWQTFVISVSSIFQAKLVG